MRILRVPHLLPTLALVATMASAGPAHAQDDVNARLQIHLGSYPHWTVISGTQVDELPMAERPNYDVFRYGGTYYAYSNGRWYSSTNSDGDYYVVQDNAVPMEFSRIPREHWRTYPATWSGGGGTANGSFDSGAGTMRVRFGTQPRWVMVPGTSAYEVPMTDRPDYDVFREGSTYYVYDNDRWYSSTRPEGDYTAIGDNYVPADFNRIPRDHWRSYPSRWSDRRGGYRNPNNNGSGYGNNGYGNNGNYDGSTTLQMNWSGNPHWRTIRGTRVMELRADERTDYDVFRYRGGYYAYANGHWYMAHHQNDSFVMIDDRAVPAEFSSIPRDHWRNYPSGWQDQQQQRPRHRRDWH
jgi:hypothetical protein